MSNSNLPHISVCIPTFKRPVLLDRCLGAMQGQGSRGFSYSIVVVDNDVEESARGVVDGWRGRSCAPLGYDVEPVQNISLARNRAVANARGDFIAFVDDDEFPEPNWLREMFEACGRLSADGVLGPVIPLFEGTPPKWLVKSGLCARKSFQTGARMNDLKHMRSGNLLFRHDISVGDSMLFDPRFGLTGGEDTEFFERMMNKGRQFAWCNEGVVHEMVPKERQSRAYHLKRAMIRGLAAADQYPFLGTGTLKSIIAVLAYTICLPFLLIAGHHLFIKYLVRDCDHLGKLLAHCGLRPVSRRVFH